MPHPPSRRGFTLIELLVVIAIIAILAAILFPVFARVREKARQTACLSNLKQIALALEQYKDDYEGYFPPSQTGTSGVNLLSWPSLIYPYVKSQDVYVCPSSTDSTFTTDSQYVSAPSYKFTNVTDTKYNVYGETGDGSTKAYCATTNACVNRLSYGRNLIPNTSGSWTTAGFYGTGPKQGFVTTGTTISINEAQIEAPATTIHIFDAMTGTASTSDVRGQGSSIRGIQAELRTDHFTTVAASKVAYTHFGGFNAIYGDAHCHWRKYGTTKACDWSIQDDTCP